ncbi:Retrovirus-related Pol polyprotein from transposon 412 [Triplophysa tibetana]|uniref:Gypsy retrotransposon integrase-like protein 1 n=1 Tax=Triplophysa tibetana TaxID=1572043 RepID=A0A5A9PRW0_9TELE|nr:Retrovirus-related Pol polyprotein from transposon 412 [Triplophysa tibetana]
MALGKHPSVQVELANWCKDVGLFETHALMLFNVPVDTDVAVIEDVMQTVKALGKVRVRDTREGPTSRAMLVLCECKQAVDSTRVPPEVTPNETGEPWTVVVVSNQETSPETTSEGFTEKLTKFLMAEGKSFTDVQALFTTRSSAEGSPASIIRAVGEILEKTAKHPGDSSAYRRLRTLSATVPTPVGEESIENWMEQARLMIAECECSEKEKRRRIIESVKGPALEIIRAVRFSNPEASALQYLEALESTFGSSESGEDLYFKFRLMRQNAGEALSGFLRRIDKALCKVVERDGLSSLLVDKVRVEQLIRGAVHSDMLLLQLGLRERKNRPPSFLSLLKEIREAEENEAARHRMTAKAKSIQYHEDERMSPSVLLELKSEIQELRSRLSCGEFKPVATSSMVLKAKEKFSMPSEKTDDSEVQALREQIHQLQQQLAVMNVGKPQQSFQIQERKARPCLSQAVSASRVKLPRPKDDYFCYRCGEDGHISTKCQAAPNAEQVIQKLIRSLRKSKSGKHEESGDHKNDQVCFSKRSQTEVNESSGLPKGLVGPASTIEVKLNGCGCKALLDSGSQVTIVFEDWYSKNLPDVPIHPLTGLSIWGLSSSSYPYKGYVVVDVTFPASVIGVEESLSILALVCPEPQGPTQLPVIIGTNASFFTRLAALSREFDGSGVAHALRIQTCDSEICIPQIPGNKTLPDTSEGNIKWMGPGDCVIPSRGEVCTLCQLHTDKTLKKEFFVVDRPVGDSLPAGLLIIPVLLPFSAIEEKTIKVLMQNETSRDIPISAGTVIANVYPTDTVLATVGSPKSAVIDSQLFKFGEAEIPEAWEKRLRQKLSLRGDVFSIHEWDVGLAEGVEHHIRLHDNKPFRERSRRLAPADIEDVRRHIKDLLVAGIIKESRSPYASPIVIARKKNGAIRMCIDYRTLNARTVPDQYTTPRIEDALDCLAGSRWFSVLDLRSGYYQLPMAEEDKEKTAFICPLGFFQFERMPQGITGAPATFQRLMEKAVGDMHLLQVIVYLDDIIVFGSTLEEHEERLLKVLDRLRECGLKVSIDKCQFCQSKVRYVGHIVSAAGVSPDPAKIEAVTKWKMPTDLKSLRSFLGFCGFYRRFVKDYSAIVRALTELTKGYPPTSRRTKKSADRPLYFKESDPFGTRWDEPCTTAFHNIIHRLTHAPVLAFADPTKPYVLHVDASLNGLGAVLNQEHPDGLRPVAYASRKLSLSERRYPVHQLEFLALKWAVVDKFHDYLYGAQFVVMTDNNPVTYVLSSAKLNATGHRWLAALATYNFSLKYKPGRHSVDADLLSRHPCEPSPRSDWKEIPKSAVRAICQVALVPEGEESSRLVDHLGLSPQSIPDAYACPTVLSRSPMEQLSTADLRKAQEEDPIIGEVKREVESGRILTSKKSSNASIALLQRQCSKLKIQNNLLYRVTHSTSGREKLQLVLPEKYWSQVLCSLHDSSGHLGVEKTTELVKDRFYWPKMSPHIEQYIKCCGSCIARKTLPKKVAPMNHMTSSGPFDLVCIDFLSIEPDSRGIGNVLVVTDHFTRYAQAFACKDQKALTVAKTLCDKFFIHYGLPSRIHSDQGRDFESGLIKELLKMLGIRKSRTTPYHPQGDPQPERFNRTLLSMLGTLNLAEKSRWSEHINRLVHAYNCTRNESTGYSPYYLLFGREARLPVDVCFGTSSGGKGVSNHRQYVERMKLDLQRAYQLATETAQKSQQRNKRLYDKRVTHQTLAVGDRVLIRNLAVTGKNKLGDKWNSFPYLVVEKLKNLPVYRLKPERGMGSVRTLHRDHILPIRLDVRLNVPEDLKAVRVPPETRARSVIRKQGRRLEGTNVTTIDGNLSCDSESEEELCNFYPDRVDMQPQPDNHDQAMPAEEEAVREVINSPSTPGNETIPLSAEEDLEESNPAEAGGLEQEGGETRNETPPKDVVEHVPLRPRREIRPVIKLSYDRLGQSSSRPLTLVHRGMVVNVEERVKLRENLCNTVWCHPLALCSKCGQLTISLEPRLSVPV